MFACTRMHVDGMHKGTFGKPKNEKKQRKAIFHAWKRLIHALFLSKITLYHISHPTLQLEPNGGDIDGILISVGIELLS